jgi:signal transduction histidine kinase
MKAVERAGAPFVYAFPSLHGRSVDQLHLVAMGGSVMTLGLRTQQDVLLTRRRARDLAGLLQLGAEAQSRLATAVGEVARLTQRHGSGGAVDLAVCEDPASAVVTISGISRHALLGDGGVTLDRVDLAGLRQLVDRVETRMANGAASIRLTSDLAHDAWIPGTADLTHVLRSLQRHESGEDEAAVHELRMQNAELMSALTTLNARERELTALNRELGDTNRAVTDLLAELGQQAGELRERAAAAARFLATLTHELRTPLYAARGLAEAILREGEGLEATVREDIALLDSAVVEALDLVNDQLDLAKLAAGCETVSLSQVRVDELFSALRGTLGRLPRSREVALVFEDPDGIPPLRTDRFKLGQILRNFIVNGLKFTDRGEVRVSARVVARGAAVRFAVADTGPGLQPCDQTRIFEEFVQLGEEHGGLRGSGLGLPLTRRLAGLLGGEVDVASAPGHGATFRATIPVSFDGSAGADGVSGR